MIVGMLNTKDAVGYFRPLTNLVDTVYTIPLINNNAGICPTILAEAARKVGLPANPQAHSKKPYRELTQSIKR